MSQERLCLLCVNNYLDHINLYDEDGQRNEAYELVQKYFDKVSLEEANHLTAICLECWRQIYDFHIFQHNVYEAQKQYQETHRVVIKLEEEEMPLEEDIVYQSQDQEINSEYENNVLDHSLDEINEGNCETINTFPKLEPLDEVVEYTSSSSSSSKVPHKESDEFIAQWKPNLKCELCNEICLYLSILEKHFEDKHPQEKCFIVCCQRKLYERNVIGDHIQHHIDPNAFSCRLCSKICKSRALLNAHTRTVHWKEMAKIKRRSSRKKPSERFNDLIAKWKSKLKCALCGWAYSTLKKLREHFRQSHTQHRFYIECCQRKLQCKKTIEDHIRLHMDPNAFTCKLCGKRYKTKISLHGHMRIQHSSSSKRKEKKITTDREYENLVAQWKPVLECFICMDTCSTLTSLKEHFSNFHPDNDMYVECCNRKLKRRQEITEHARYHTDPNAFRCEICNIRFSRRSSLIQHMCRYHPIRSIHLNNKGTKFEQMSAIEEMSSSENELIADSDDVHELGADVAHRKSTAKAKKHIKKKPTERINDLIAQSKFKLQCAMCSKSFPTLNKLQQHFRQSHSQSQFYIECCQRKLKATVSIEEHIRLHVDPNAFTCKLCDKRYTTKFSLLAHMSIAHSTLNTEIGKKSERKVLTDQEYDDLIIQWKPKLECVICKRKCPTFTLLKHHFGQIHPHNELYIECCKRKLKRRLDIIEHARFHTDPDAFKCEICGMRFSMRSSLIRHLCKQHPNPNSDSIE